MAPIRSVMACALLAIALTVALPVPDPKPADAVMLKNVKGTGVLFPSDNEPSLMEPIDGRHRHHVVGKPHRSERRKVADFLASVPPSVLSFFLGHGLQSAPVAHEQNGQLVAFADSHRDSTKVRRQSSISSMAGRMMFGVAQTMVNSGSVVIGNIIADKLTGNDLLHPQKSAQQLEQEEKEEKIEEAEKATVDAEKQRQEDEIKREDDKVRKEKEVEKKQREDAEKKEHEAEKERQAAEKKKHKAEKKKEKAERKKEKAEKKKEQAEKKKLEARIEQEDKEARKEAEQRMKPIPIVPTKATMRD